jgi:hypothetical protein
MNVLRTGASVAKVCALVGACSLAAYGVHVVTRFVWDEHKLKELLDEEVDAIATDFVADDGRQEVERGTQIVLYHGGIALGRVHEAINETIDIGDNTRGVATLNRSKVDVDQHRVVTRRKRTSYINTVVAECRLTFGVCSRSEANEKAVRRVAVKIMKTHGVRPTHINAMLPQVVEMVFIPTNSDIEARALGMGWAAWFRGWRWARLAPPPSYW